MNKFNRICIVGKYKSAEVQRPVSQIIEFLRSEGADCLVDDMTAQQLPGMNVEFGPIDDVVSRSDLVVVLGGDGTLLGLARTAAMHDVPLLGINLGRLGFLADISLNKMVASLRAVQRGEYITDDRAILEASADSEPENGIWALNDVSIGKGQSGSLIQMKVTIDGEFAYNLRSDGLVVSTPTGSTAYALSAGGPIIAPGVDCILLAPVCPHSLSNRPIVIPGTSKIEIELMEAIDAHVHIDSHTHLNIQQGGRLMIQVAAAKVRLVHSKEHDYFGTLREKLHWAGTMGS
ncbi:MAG: NAD kinase [Betaproteobacteria bacterium]|jgi:NAD+ kinase|nr:NAD kinase [Betaproteobacteria bacterium]MCH1424747.1 NAD(+)/NADH kinase [Burkholderiales bacterium]MDG1143093.1 NAD(+)/NADH kinase [Burkholderiales bacterium]